MNQEHLYVKEVMIGKKLGHPRLDIKGRGRQGVMHSIISSIKIVLEERPMEEVYK